MTKAISSLATYSISLTGCTESNASTVKEINVVIKFNLAGDRNSRQVDSN